MAERQDGSRITVTSDVSAALSKTPAEIAAMSLRAFIALADNKGFIVRIGEAEPVDTGNGGLTIEMSNAKCRGTEGGRG